MGHVPPFWVPSVNLPGGGGGGAGVILKLSETLVTIVDHTPRGHRDFKEGLNRCNVDPIFVNPSLLLGGVPLQRDDFP